MTEQPQTKPNSPFFSATLMVAALGYFVDLFDITLFGVVRTASLNDLGVVAPDQVLSQGIRLYNAQMIGMMIGGVFWGRLGDRKGRSSVLLGSILLYSLANIANAFVSNVDAYAACRFLCGVGLAGELGAAITLVAESLPKEKRGLGTTFVAATGMFGIVVAALIGQWLSWKESYLIGGILGLALLSARFKVGESTLFRPGSKSPGIRFFLRRQVLLRYIACIAIGVPIYFTTGVLFTFAPELTAGLVPPGSVTAGNAILFGSIGLTLGDLVSGLLSQWLKRRRLALAICLLCGLGLLAIYGMLQEATAALVYTLSFAMGLTIGYWAVLVTVAAELFGTNVRATVTTTVPNFVRGSAVFAVGAFAALKNSKGALPAAMWVGGACFAIALFSLFAIEETFGRDLDFSEKN